MAWVDKRELVPGGCEGLHEEIALSLLQVSLAADPQAPTRSLMIDLLTAAEVARANEQVRNR